MTQPSKARIKEVVGLVIEQCTTCAAFGGCTIKASECTVRTMINKKPIAANATDENCYISGDEVKTTSLKVAEVFGKMHKDILRKLETLDCSKEFNERNFTLVKYIDKKGERRPMYEMTKDGFMFAVMGFTGKKAARLKEAYIVTFNQMAEQLRNGAGFAIPKSYAGALQLAADQQKQREQHDTGMDAVKSAMDDMNKAFNNFK